MVDLCVVLALQASLCQGIAGAPANGSNWSVARQQHRLSGHSCESGVASFTSSRLSYLSVASGSSHDSINRLPEDDESAYASIVNFAELYENGYTVSDLLSRHSLCGRMCVSCSSLLQQILHLCGIYIMHVQVGNSKKGKGGSFS